ncbi:CvpA family protein [Rhodoferax sp. GW822-FHT02A01]|uniref:CvpA family protein n=1 Tax=Rhodoferax sp. GW822-FHT02A01 TaxID=3141537 RepID=UPI00315DB4C0
MLEVLPLLDWVCIGILLASMVVGAWRGLVVEVLSLASWAVAFVLAQWFAPDVAAKLPMAGAGEQVRYAAGFVLIFVATLFAGALLGFVLSKVLSAVGMGAINRLLGALFGVLRGVVLILAITVVVGMTPWKSSREWQASTGVRWATSTLGLLKPVLPQEFGKYLPTT